MMSFFLVFLGGGLGSAARHGVNLLAVRLFGFQFPLGTLLINIVGSLAMGVVVEYGALKSGLPQQMRLFLTTGVIGGFTTFSTFTLEIALLNGRGEQLAAALYAIGSVIFGLAAFYGGAAIVRAMP